MSVEELLADATNKGLYLVNHEDPSGLFGEFANVVDEAEKLCQINDPVEQPYKSKYAAREKIDAVVNKIDATKTIASLEKNKELIKKLEWRLASLRVKLGAICWDVEEPHNAQTELELAGDYYFPGFCSRINSENLHDTDVANGINFNTFDMSNLITREIVESLHVNYSVDAMKCLNLLGILWAGRQEVKRAFCYLLTSSELYKTAKKKILDAKSPVFPLPPPPPSSEVISLDKLLDDIEESYTLNLYYLAQAYGHVGNTRMSSLYCYNTLNRQLQQGAVCTPAGVVEWCVNCQGLSDFFLATSQYSQAAYVLSVSEKLLVWTKSTSAFGNSANDSLSEKLNESLANCNRRWSKLDMVILKNAVDRMDEWASAEPSKIGAKHGQDGEDISFAPFSGLDQVVFKTEVVEGFPADMILSTIASIPFILNEPDVSTGGSPLPVPFSSSEGITPIRSYDDARTVFLRSQHRLENAKKYYVLDGYVTDHINLIMDHSRLFQYLSVAEPDVKRKLAMALRRVEMLTPIIKTVSRTAYEHFHKQISYELGEIYITCLDLKLSKALSQSKAKDFIPIMQQHKNALDQRTLASILSVSDCKGVNEYCVKAIVVFAYFSKFYEPRGGNVVELPVSTGSKSFETVLGLTDWKDALSAACLEPDLQLLTFDELRPYLNSQFLTCHALGKIFAICSDRSTVVLDNAMERELILSSLRRYQWMVKKVPEICALKKVGEEKLNLSIEMIPFDEEFNIAKEMCDLLPSKLDALARQR